MSENGTIEERLMHIVTEQLNVNAEDIRPESNFADDLGADSLDLVEMIMAIEEEFGASVPDEVAEKIQTFQDAVNYINKALAEGLAE